MATDQPDHEPLHVAFFPLMAPGHTIPTLDMVRLFSARDVKTTIITTPLNAPNFTNSLKTSPNATLEIFPFPPDEANVPRGVENMEHCTSPDMLLSFLLQSQLLRRPLEEFLQRTRLDCLVSDHFLPFAAESAAKFGVPVVRFHGTSFFALCAYPVLLRDKPHLSVGSDEECFLLPGFPHSVRLTRLQVATDMRENLDSELTRILEAAFLSEPSYGTIVNSFYELEQDCADYYRTVLGKRAWHIGPVSLYNRDNFNKGSINEHDQCLKWLDWKQPDSVIYVCFGSMTRFSSPQLHEIAMGLEASGQQFIWVVKKSTDEQWIPQGFEHRTKDKGLILRGWAPQRLILEHKAVGGFVTHCGWNSTLEAISAGVPMVTWPVFAEQFLNEKLVTEVLKVGISIGAKVWGVMVEGSVIKKEQIEATLKKLMVGEEGMEMRSRVKKLKEMAWKAIQEGGSSHSDLTALLQDLSSDRQKKLRCDLR